METKRLTLQVQIKKASTKLAFDSRFWDVIEKDSERVIGHCGFHTWNQIEQQAEIAYGLQKKFQKKGLMLEAIQPIIEFGFSEMKLKKIEAYIKIKNLPSKKLILKLGFIPEENSPENIANPDYIEYFHLLKSDI